MTETIQVIDDSKVTINDFINESDLGLDQLFKIATKFFKDNESKAFHLSYNERNYFFSLVSQVKHGKYLAEKAIPLGPLDIIGKDRRQAWADLGSMDQKEAMRTFIKLLYSSCPSFKPFIEAHKRKKEEREELRKKDEKAKEEAQRLAQEEAKMMEDQRFEETFRKIFFKVFERDH